MPYRSLIAPLFLLVVEDDAVRADCIEQHLAEFRGAYQVDRASGLAEAVDRLRANSFDAVLLDLSLPDSNGLDTIHEFREASKGTAVVVLTRTEDPDLALEAVRAGVQDFVVEEELTPELLTQVLRYACERHRLHLELEQATAKLRHETRTDPLTGLLNRRGFEERLAQERGRAARRQEELVALLVDVDDFKSVNDELGHATGDVVLRAVSERMAATCRRTDAIGRVGGDEFLMLLPDTRPAEARRLAEKLRDAIHDEPVRVDDDLTVRVSISIGMTAVAARTISVDEILESAGPGLKQSKRFGKNRISDSGTSWQLAFDPAELLSADAMFTIEVPVVRLGDEATVGWEVLARSRIEGLEHPATFFQIATDSELLPELDLACFAACARTAAELPPGLDVHLNLLPATLLQRTPDELLSLIPAGANLHGWFVDLSDQQIVGDPTEYVPRCEALRRAGLRIALDDAPWNANCFEALIALRPEIVKLDPRLVSDTTFPPTVDRLRRIAALCHRLGARAVCEGIETRGQYRLARDLGIELGEGPLWPLGYDGRRELMA